MWAGFLGTTASATGDYPEARSRLEEALAIAREVGDRRFEGSWLGQLGVVATATANHTEARSWFEAALVLAGELDLEASDLLEDCAELLAKHGQYEDAAQILGAANARGQRTNGSRSASEEARYRATLQACRDRLDEGSLSSATERGAALDWPAARHAALEMLRRLAD